MRVTQEADYAIRICCALDEEKGMLDAETLADRVAITKSIALKVLKKLKNEGILSSQKGSSGGYYLNVDPAELTALRIIEAIEGSVYISKCLSCEHSCSKNGDNKLNCKMHIAFTAINDALVERLKSVTVRNITDPSVTSLEVIKKVK